ncbi:alpha/beta hydrolase [Deinococcus metallilatus]|uniref:Lysophospholipase n=1 Tax=Deinococcus metallilatus TaxID=1211322 RepID=A0AAJ5K0G9_9DEIO|nr:alpha/beta hydrolase [Deinococcus metallilatus]MBB5294857.1 alpha-beta hydrolase superfamily lysophospholipase [Deinococcus metallilatus]QBY09427.1 alpha/beta hydrolase [Deinococcus metallilatus]RXJ09432.1 alpha/beta hydrolase [Deinococcus metallilatus]TLK28955.1 lysophospholipase [Deinococcus metallilatus]GMA16784.1 hydrolase [Deinococcus metallilatus]
MQNASWEPSAWDLSTGKGGAPVQGYVWQAEDPRAAVLLAHGFGEYAGRYVERYHRLIPALVEAGFSVYAYDHRGHGRSEGRRAVVDAATLVEDHLRARETLRRQPLPVFAFGHSLGGLVTAASAARDPRGLSGVLLSSPALLIGEDQPAWLKSLAPVLAKVAPAAPAADLGTGGLSRLTDEVSAYRADPNIFQGKVPALAAASMLRLSGQLWPQYARWTLPTLVFHGTADRITDPDGSRRFVEAIPAPDKTLRLVEGGYHELLNDEPREEVLGWILDWLRERTQEPQRA